MLHLAVRDSTRQPNSSRTLRRKRGTARRNSPRSGNPHKDMRCLKAYVEPRRMSCADVPPAYVVLFDPFSAGSCAASAISTHLQSRRRGNQRRIRAPATICDCQLVRSDGLRLCVSDGIDKPVRRFRRRHFAAQNAVCGDVMPVECIHGIVVAAHIGPG